MAGLKLECVSYFICFHTDDESLGPRRTFADDLNAGIPLAVGYNCSKLMPKSVGSIVQNSSCSNIISFFNAKCALLTILYPTNLVN